MTDALNNLTAKTSVSPQHAALTRQAEKWVSQTFFGTLLKQMHESPFKSQMFNGGHGGEAFQPLMDQHLADRMARASGKKLVGSIVRHIERAARAKEPMAAVNAGTEGRGAQSSTSDSHGGSAKERPPHPNPLPRSTGGEGTTRTPLRNHVAPILGNNLRA